MEAIKRGAANYDAVYKITITTPFDCQSWNNEVINLDTDGWTDICQDPPATIQITGIPGA